MSLSLRSVPRSRSHPRPLSVEITLGSSAWRFSCLVQTPTRGYLVAHPLPGAGLQPPNTSMIISPRYPKSSVSKIRQNMWHQWNLSCSHLLPILQGISSSMERTRASSRWKGASMALRGWTGLGWVFLAQDLAEKHFHSMVSADHNYTL